jgi:Repeat of unknown function (DUF5648)
MQRDILSPSKGIVMLLVTFHFAIFTVCAQDVPYLAALKSTLWEIKSIPVCWENPSPADVTERLWVQNGVSATWERYSDIRFTGWGKCGQNSSGIRILIANEWPRVKELGNRLNAKENGMVLNFDWDGCVDKSNPASRQFCATVIGVHEFGHALGFSHEQNREDCKCNKDQGTDGDFYGTPCDINSIMNYCNPVYNNNGQLSTYDIIGLHVMYDKNATGFEHFYTWDDAEKARAISTYKFIDEGIAGYVYNTPLLNSIPLYRLVSTSSNNPGDHFYTIYKSERDDAVAKYGYKFEGISAYVLKNKEGRAHPLYRLRSKDKGFHFYTMSELEKLVAITKYNFVDEGVSCYIYGFQEQNSVPFYRLLR